MSISIYGLSDILYFFRPNGINAPKSADDKGIIPRNGGKRLFRRFLCAFVTLLLFVFFAVPARAEAVSDFVRLHVVASGDSDWEQTVKLAVRDACLAAAREWTADCENADEAYAAVNVHMASLQTAAVAAARKMGFEGSVRVETGVFAFPDRFYGALFVPAGDYRALRVTLGEGGGHNWWCVLYPSLCVVDEAAYCAAEAPPIEFYSSVGRFLRGLWGG